MSTVVLNEDEARSLLIIINGVIEDAMTAYLGHDTDGLDYIGDLFSIRKKCMEVVHDG